MSVDRPLHEVRTPHEVGVEAQSLAVVEREDLVLGALDEEELLQARELLGLLGCQVVALSRVIGPVQLPLVVGKGVPLRAELPRHLVDRARRPPFVVDPPVAHDLEVLGRVRFRRLRVIEGIGELDPLDGFLRHTVHRRRLRDPGRTEHRRSHVDHVGELVADLALGLDAAGPVDDHAGPGPAPVARDLRGPLVGGVHRVRPPHGVVVEEAIGPDLVDVGEHLLDGLLHEVVRRVLVE